MQVARAHNDSSAHPFRADLSWTPFRGNGKYTLTAFARTADAAENHFTPVASASLAVDVEGIPAGSESVRNRFVRLYSERFGLTVPIPPLARYIRPNPAALDPSRWVSVVYLGDHDYEIDLMDDGSVQTARMAVNHAEAGLATICRPMGILKILVVFVDYGNTGISQDQAFAALAAAQSQSANWHQAYAAAHGLSAPLLQINTTPAFISAPPVPGRISHYRSNPLAGRLLHPRFRSRRPGRPGFRRRPRREIPWVGVHPLRRLLAGRLGAGEFVDDRPIHRRPGHRAVRLAAGA